jgi:hypothetical protein
VGGRTIFDVAYNQAVAGDFFAVKRDSFSHSISGSSCMVINYLGMIPFRATESFFGDHAISRDAASSSVSR